MLDGVLNFTDFKLLIIPGLMKTSLIKILTQVVGISRVILHLLTNKIKMTWMNFMRYWLKT